MTYLESSFNRIKLNVGKLLPRSKVNGPGERFVIWLQGCSLKCSQCINQEFLSHEPKKTMTVSELYELITSTPNLEGVTYSGGEPFEQAEGLYYLSSLLKKKGMTIMSYSGYTYDELISKNDKYISSLLSTLDILIDSRFEADKAAPFLWRGSRNQKVYFFTERYRHYKDVINCEGVDMELSMDDKVVSFTGNFDRELLLKIAERLRDNYGVLLK